MKYSKTNKLIFVPGEFNQEEYVMKRTNVYQIQINLSALGTKISRRYTETIFNQYDIV